MQLVPDKIIGEGTCFFMFIDSMHLSYISFLTASDSPVKALSSILIPLPSTKSKSAAHISP